MALEILQHEHGLPHGPKNFLNTHKELTGENPLNHPHLPSPMREGDYFNGSFAILAALREKGLWFN